MRVYLQRVLHMRGRDRACQRACGRAPVCVRASVTMSRCVCVPTSASACACGCGHMCVRVCARACVCMRACTFELYCVCVCVYLLVLLSAKSHACHV